MYLRSHGLAVPGGLIWPIECRSMRPSSCISAFTLAKNSRIVLHADMLEHADGDDAVEAPSSRGSRSIRTGPGRRGPLSRAFSFDERVLLLRERHAGDVDILDRGEIEREIAPARADVEHLAGPARGAASPR